MNKLVNYLNDVLISLDIPPVVKETTKKEIRKKGLNNTHAPLQSND